MRISEMQRAAWHNSESHGFHEGAENQNIPTKMMLIVAEVAEALEEFRVNRIERYYNPEKPDKPEGVGPELADIVIRVGDLAQMLDIDLNDEVMVKMAYNTTRPHKHGGTMYTVPLHVGENIEVPKGSHVTFYDPKER